MEIRRIALVLASVIALAGCEDKTPKAIPEWGKHGTEPADTATPPLPPTPPEPVEDTLNYSEDLSISAAEADYCGIAVTYSISAAVSGSDS